MWECFTETDRRRSKHGLPWTRLIEAEDRLLEEFVNSLVARTVPECLLRAGCLLTTTDMERNQELPLDLAVHGPEEIGR